MHSHPRFFLCLFILTTTLNLCSRIVTANEARGGTITQEEVDNALKQCEIGLANNDHRLVEAAAQFLWNQSSISDEIKDRAEQCVSSLSETKALYTFDTGWQFEISKDERLLWPSALQSVIADAQAICNESEESELIIPRSAIEKKDLTGNAISDTIVYFGRLRCGNNSSYFSGSGGSRIALIVDNQITDFFARGFNVSYPFGDDYPVLIFAVHGTYCDGYSATNCILATVWGDNKFELVSNNH